jgi:L-threonylcarbamoyladenylate synthase
MTLATEQDIARAARLLRDGKVVAIPTETVYGLAADATNASAVRQVFALKGRPTSNPLIVHVANAAVARRCARDWDERADALARAFWPGALTIVLPKTDAICPEVTAGLDTVGLRVPKHPVTLRLLELFDGPLAAPSANKSNRVSPTTAQHVRDEFGDALPLILDGGPCDVGIESTVLTLVESPARILRPGAVSRQQIERIIGPVRDAVEPDDSRPVEHLRASPGQFPTHYSPRTPAFHFTPEQRASLDLTNSAIIECALDAETYARNFYARLRLLDTQHLSAIYIELPPNEPQWRAVRDRILRAAKHVKLP